MNNIIQSKLFRTKSLSLYSANKIVARGGGFHGPSTRLYKPYIHKRRLPPSQLYMMIFNDIGPEHIVGLYSVEYPTVLHAWFKIFTVFVLSIPVLMVMSKIRKDVGPNHLYITVKNCPDHKDTLPAVINFLMKNDFNNAQDFIGRNNASFYKNIYPEDFTNETSVVQSLRKRGFSI